MHKNLILLLLLVPNICLGKPVAKSVSIDLYKIADYRDSYWAEDKDKFKAGANFNVDLWLFSFIEWDNQVHFAGTDSQIRSGGWQSRLGLNVIDSIQLFYYHHSQHVLERERGTAEYPLQNFYGIRLRLYN